MDSVSYIGEQFHRPTGLGGRLATFVMNRQNELHYRGAVVALDLREADIVLDIGFGTAICSAVSRGSMAATSTVSTSPRICSAPRTSAADVSSARAR